MGISHFLRLLLVTAETEIISATDQQFREFGGVRRMAGKAVARLERCMVDNAAGLQSCGIMTLIAERGPFLGRLERLL